MGRRPEERRRDAERTREALLDAALDEFSAKGRAGARVSEIAEKAGVDKQLITYYFGGKDGLYRALVERWLVAEKELAEPGLPLDELVARYVRGGAGDLRLGRLLVRVSLEDDPEAEDGGTLAEEISEMRKRQEAGELAPELDPALALLMLQSAASLGVLFPGSVRMATGLEPDSEAFTERYAALLREVVRRLR